VVTTLGKGPPGELGEVQSPGIDPLQLAILFRSSTLRGTVVPVRPVVEEKDGRTTTIFDLIIDMRALTKSVGAPDNRWVDAIAQQDQGGFVDLRVGLADHEVASLATDLPIRDTSDTSAVAPSTTDGTQRPQFLHAVTELVVEGVR